jgi:drug/metabolite transporter (DMT)-like permease
MNRKQAGALLLLGAIWGASFLFMRIAVVRPETPNNFPPVTLATIRMGLAAVVLYGFMLVRGIPFPWHRWRAMGVLGLINAALPYFFFAWGEQYINSNLAAIYNATAPLWSVLLAWFFVPEERISGLRNIGIALGFAGVVYLFSGSLTGPRAADRLALWGELVCIAAGLCYAMGNMWTRRRLRGEEPLALASGQLLFGTAWALPVALGVEQPWGIAPSGAAIAALTTLSLLGTAIAMLIFFWLLGEVGSTRTAQVTYLLPIFGLFWGSLIGEPITSRIVTSLLLILAGIVVVNGGLEWLLRRRRLLGRPGSDTR